MRRSSILTGIGLFAVIIAAGAGLGLYKYRKIKDAAAAPHAAMPPQVVQLAKAETVNWRPMADLVGTVFSIRSVLVKNELAGRVTSVKFESGSVVEEGDELIALDDATAQADLAAMKAAVRVAEANVIVADARLSLAKAELERLEGAAEARAVSAMELDRSRSELQRATADRERLVAEIDQAEARVAQVQARLDKMVMHAPFRARAGLRTVHEGQYLEEGADIVLLEEVSDKIYLDFPIPQEYAPRVHPGLVVMATSDVLGPEPVRIEVVAVDAVVNNATRNLRIRAVVDNPNGRLRAGMFVQIRVPVEDARDYTVVPATAVRRASFADQVFVVVPGEKQGEMIAHQRFVKLGPTIGDNVIILDGIKDGETVASTGSFKLFEGAAVATAPAPAAAPATAAPDAASERASVTPVKEDRQ